MKILDHGICICNLLCAISFLLQIEEKRNLTLLKSVVKYKLGRMDLLSSLKDSFFSLQILRFCTTTQITIISERSFYGLNC